MNAMGQPDKKQHAIRRSTRLPLEVPVRLTSLDGATSFSEQCNTNLVNAHGCGVIVTRAIAPGSHLRIEIVAGKQSATARVAEVVHLGGDPETWLVGLELDVPGNFWGIQYAPSDWKIEPKVEADIDANPEASPATSPETSQETGKIETNNRRSEGEVPEHDSIAAATQFPSRKWRLTDISVGACYMESTLPFPADTPVLMSIRAMNTECLLEGIVRVSHPGKGMGIEFTRGQGDLQARVEELIARLTSSREVPRIFVGRIETNGAVELPSDEMQSVANDPLLKLLREEKSLSMEQFLSELRALRPGAGRNLQSHNTLSSSALVPGQL